MEQIYAEKIIKMRRAMEEKEEEPSGKGNPIEDGYVLVRYEKLELEEKEIMDGRAFMVLPKQFKPMPDQLVAVKYPDPDRPEWILSDPEGRVAVTFHLEEGEMEEGDLEQITFLLKSEMERLHPASKAEDGEAVGEGSNRILWFSQDIPLIDDDCCHVMFFRSIREGLVMGTFDCPKDEKKQWMPILKEFLKTMKEPGEEENREDKDADIPDI